MGGGTGSHREKKDKLKQVISAEFQGKKARRGQVPKSLIIDQKDQGAERIEN